MPGVRPAVVRRSVGRAVAVGDETGERPVGDSGPPTRNEGGRAPTTSRSVPPREESRRSSTPPSSSSPLPPSEMRKRSGARDPRTRYKEIIRISRGPMRSRVLHSSVWHSDTMPTTEPEPLNRSSISLPGPPRRLSSVGSGVSGRRCSGIGSERRNSPERIVGAVGSGVIVLVSDRISRAGRRVREAESRAGPSCSGAVTNRLG
jgi:hypothetical protein